MATKMKTYDWGGISLIVNELLLATKPGQKGSATTISAAELSYLDGITAGTTAASKAWISDSSNDVATTGYITGARKEIVDDGTTVVLTVAQSGAVIHLNSGAAAAFTLPAAVAGSVGVHYHVYVGVTTHADTTFTCGEGDFYVGTVTLVDIDTDAVDVAYTGDGSADDILTLNGTTTGGVAGTWFDVICISATQWLIRGYFSNSGDDADPFSA